ncbi:hypothetical protein PspLS_04255 [Pyricularia sp. CBS 133598]|nr:hypothetical protein PspLS_04255 [Pyricularia sp. CBS 133598]
MLNGGTKMALSALAVRAASAMVSPGPLTKMVSVFAGTAQNNDPGNVFAGASVPFGMAKVTINVDGYAPAGYVSESKEIIKGMSPLHDSGTGSADGSYGQFSIMPVVCGGFESCPTIETARGLRRDGDGVKDQGFPGYFSTPLTNGVLMEAASTQGASLERYTFPAGVKPTLVLDWTTDGTHSFNYGQMHADWPAQRILMNGTWFSSFGPSLFRYTAFQCVDLSTSGKFTDHEFWGANPEGWDARRNDTDSWNFGRWAERRRNPALTQPTNAGAIVRFGNTTGTIVVRRGVSFVSAEKACQNMEQQIPSPQDFDKVVAASNALWETKLRRIELADGTPDHVRQLFYTNLYRTFLSPNNATGDAPPPYTDSPHPYFDGLYCSWDTFRTLFPLMALTSPREMAQITDSYVDGFRREGWLPECRANNVKGWVQGGNNGVPIVADFMVKYAKHAGELGVNMDDYWAALEHDISATPPNWDYEGRNNEAYNKLGYIPYGFLESTAVGQHTREFSRGLEYSFGDFTAAMAAQALGKPADVWQPLLDRSLKYGTNYNMQLESDGYRGFVARRFPNGTFPPSNPVDCSPLDKNTTRPCSLQATNVYGGHESSSWEYSFYAPHDGAGLVKLLGGNETFNARVQHFFQKGYNVVGNEPSFQTPSLYHHVGLPGSSVRESRRIVLDNFNLTRGGSPGNDDNAAMSSLVIWYMLGFYPVPGSAEMLVLSPFVPGYMIHNELLGDVHVTVTGYDAATVANSKVPNGGRAFVEDLKLDGKSMGRCRIDFDQFFSAKQVEFVMTAEEKKGCNGQEPSSASTGGFPVAWTR